MTTDDFGTPLPTEAYTLEGMVFNPSGERWKLRDTAGILKVDWRRFDRWMAPRLVHSFKHVLLWYVENRALSTARNIHDRLTALLIAMAASGVPVVKAFTQAHLQNYRSSLKPSEEWKLATLSAFFRRWSDQGHPGVDPAAVEFLEEITLKGNLKGIAVSTSDPTTGPFTVVEASTISSAVSDALATGQITLRQYCITVLMAALGSRAVQFAALKCCDLRPPDPEGGSPQWILDVPRAKQRYESARTRRCRTWRCWMLQASTPRSPTGSRSARKVASPTRMARIEASASACREVLRR